MTEGSRGPLSVSQVNDYLKMLMDGDRVLSNLFVRGEISNLTVARSGHIYFTLKDEEGQLRAVMFRTYADRLSIRLSDGMRVIVHGHVSLYGPSGQYQLYADELQPDGVGTLAMQFEQIKRKLQAEGLFDPDRKRPIPPMPMRVGIITSPTGAAIHDMIRVSGRRFPCAELILYPSLVQGLEAAEQLASGIMFFEMTRIVDVIIIGRGGGSVEDLWAFNDEMLARTVAACTIPVISAVGHESDFTICDFVADLRAPTPSSAAELALPDQYAILSTLDLARDRLVGQMQRILTQERKTLERLAQSRVLTQPGRLLDTAKMRLAVAQDKLDAAVNQSQSAKKELLARACARLEALSPLAVLRRGYAAVTKDDIVVTSAHALQEGDEIEIRFADGEVSAKMLGRKGAN